MKRSSYLAVVGVCSSVASCEWLGDQWDQPARVGCEAGADAVDLTVDPALTDRPIVLSTEPLKISGTARHQCGLAIRQIVVDGIQATPVAGAFNLARWEALVPVGVLLAPDAGAPGGAAGPNEQLVLLTVQASDAVGVARTITVNLRVRRPTNADVPDLALRVDPARSWFPVDGRVRALLTVSGGTAGVGAGVRLSATPAGSVVPGLVTLGGEQAMPSAQAMYVPAGTEGPIRVFAVGGTRTAFADIVVAAAPRFSPPSVQVPVGSTVFFEASSPSGDIVHCGPSGASIAGWRLRDVASDAVVGAAGVTRAIPSTPGVRITFSVERVEADASLAAPLQFSCTDSAGQRGTLSIQPAP